MSIPRIVVTGIGASSPIGGTAPESWSALLGGASGARTLEYDWVEQYNLPVTFAAQAAVRPDTVLERPIAKRLDPSSQFALVAAMEAWADAGSPEVDPERLGVDFATGIGGLWTLLDAWDTLREKGPRRVLPMTVPMLMPNAAAGNLSLHFGARAYARTVASACASSTESIVNAIEHLRDGLADVVIAGGTESVIHPVTIASFSSMQALSKRNDSPETASRPGSIDRDGFVMGEGAGVLILETEEHAKARGAKIYAVVVGGGVTADSYHITANDPEGTGAARAVNLALAMADASPDDVTHINAHATSTPVGDPNEYVALKSVFGDRIDEIPVSATKASTGHLLGGTGALEAIFTILAIRDRVAPPTINMTEQDPAVPFRLSGAPTPLGDGPQLAISNSFGFGGHNAVAAFASV
ncbi:MAG: beta-ketoacyl-[acyl-carrier-protein] synthase II [Microbacterium sp. 69-7]|jgi:3-oxoacyl-[acyl-carrier-protein] synthase II|uniref:beta-ketoacyl-[acyl-carrier-protein] synthase family protein n=1 Tax=unclassified Microbacterium TaxID=2609290 RepID=UPI0002587A5B|nr:MULTISPECIES: beta-ketoacyl-[acyl-carrier-protein] synthase family protein [unclassified Microbacterium]EIC08603.1 Beta-ketoacyl synthase [Microbacterium laevaniformans OR221]EPD83279.1 beta-ketoacyl-acyl-carrier-protein synthase II [Microbacterium sp. oral taxon 186 str. F0373]EXJ52905.1 3-oxoacyl-ACP synthase [Microbacterium sp. MRS-1]OJU43735.1 MAG: beta-ketoacyl-[acyl-carrier-protein] synthase II [Microbacterium sp. 69-7]RKS84865.1 3-oxoacyl-[acyl-carrier-protein] synthase II [Microbact